MVILGKGHTDGVVYPNKKEGKGGRGTWHGLSYLLVQGLDTKSLLFFFHVSIQLRDPHWDQ